MIYSKKPFVPRGPLHPSVHRQAHCPANSLHLCVVKTCLITLLFHSSSKYTWNSPFSCKCYSNLNQITPHANTLSHQTGNIISMWYSTMSTYLLTFIDPVCCVERQSNMAWVDNELTIIRFPRVLSVLSYLHLHLFMFMLCLSLSVTVTSCLSLLTSFRVCVFLFISSFSLLDVSKSAFQPPSMHVSSCPFAHRRSFFLSLILLFLHLLDICLTFLTWTMRLKPLTSSQLFTWELI